MAAPRPLPPLELTGADCFLRAFHGDTMRVHGAGHLSQVVLRLGAGFDPKRLEETLERVVRANPILRAPIRRRGGLGPPVYRIDLAEAAPQPRVHRHAATAEPARGAAPSERAIPPVFFEALNARMAIERGELLRADVVPSSERGADGEAAKTDLALTWAHMLLDGSGSEAFVELLDAVARGARAPEAVPTADRTAEVAEARPRGPLRDWSREAQTWQRHVQGMGAHPPRSLAGPRPGAWASLREGGRGRGAQQLRYEIATLGADATARVDERAKERAGVLTPMLFYLAAAIRAHAAVFEARGVTPESYVVPVPVNLRPKGQEGGIFRTRVSMFWFQVLADEARSLDACVASLKRQRHALIKSGGVANGVAAMHLVRAMPARLYAAMARRTLRGELCSFFFAWTGEFLPGLTEFMGAPIENGFHTPSVPPSPGSGAIMSVREGRLNLAHVAQRGVMSDEEGALLRASLLGELLGA